MIIKRIGDLTENERKTCKTVMSTQNLGDNKYTTEIRSSFLALNEGAKKIYSTIAVFENEEQMVYHEVFLDTLTPEQMNEAISNISGKLQEYIDYGKKHQN